jgi:two-component system sensor histidine kinase/response regulator
MMEQRGYIMIVDDNPANLKLLEDMLCQQTYQVRAFPRGRLALRAAEQKPPDLILLDINMPELNGYEVCERLKTNRKLADIPVIFLSALNEVQDKVKAFSAGAVDYISKPFEFQEVHARVATHLKLYELQRGLELQNERLEEAVAARTHELAEANRRLIVLDRSKSEFLGIISHEFRTPLNGLLGVGDLILEGMPANEENTGLKEVFQHARRRILSILDEALVLTRIDLSAEQVNTGPVSMRVVLSRAIESVTDFAESREVTLSPASDDLDFVMGDEDLLVLALRALLETAVKFSEKGRAVGLALENSPDSLRVLIECEGRTIPTSTLPSFFELFSIGEAITPGGDLGLSAPLADRILGLFGASVSVENIEPSGIRLTICLKGANPQISPHGPLAGTPELMKIGG